MTHAPHPTTGTNRSTRKWLLAAACGVALAGVAGFAVLHGRSNPVQAAPGSGSGSAPTLINPTAPGGAGAAGQTDYAAKASVIPSGDLTMWGGTPHRNMVSAEKNAPTEWDVDSHKNIKWEAELGSKSYGNPIISEGKIFIGTNNESKKDPKYSLPNGDAIDGGVEMAFDEKTGKFLWQQYYSKLPSGRVNDWPGEGLCSTAYTEKGRLWYCTNRCEVVCLDISASEPREVWKLDMMGKLGVFPHNMTASAPVAYGDYIYVETGNGVDDTHKNVVAPQAPGIVAINKNTGEVKWTSNVAGENVLHGQWASVSVTEVKGADGKVTPLVIAPLGDGWVYAFHALSGEIVWKFDSNPKDSIYPQTRNEIIATPVIHNNRMYFPNGQDPEHGTGYAHLWCVDITKTGDISAELPADPAAPKPKVGEELVQPAGAAPSRKGKPNPNSGVVWHYYANDDNGDGKIQETERFHRSISTVAIADGLVYAPDFSGYLHCLDANTGKKFWAHDLEADIWGSPLLVDGKVYVGDGDGDIHIFKHGKQKEEIAVNNMGAAVYGSPVMANGTLYVMSMHKLYAIAAPGAAGAQPAPGGSK